MSNEDPWEWAKITAEELGLPWPIAEEIMFSMSPEVFGTALQWVKKHRSKRFRDMDLNFAFFNFMNGRSKALQEFRKFGFSYPSKLSRSNATLRDFFYDVASILNNMPHQ